MKNLLAHIKEEINKIEECIYQVLGDDGTWDQVYHHLLQSKGKYLRPALFILAGRFGPNYSSASFIPPAAAMELIHMATLIHDDVIDLAQVRRGNSTINAHFGNMMAVLTGDCLFARAFLLLAEQGKACLTKTMAQVVVAICSGETEQILNAYNLEQTEGDYLRRVEQKTASFLAASCHLGGLLSECSQELSKDLEEYGFNLGMAFQIADDFLDLVGQEEKLGKTPGGDLRQGIMTLPIIYALHNSPRREDLRKMLESKQLAREDFPEALEIVLKSGALEYSQEKASFYLERASKVLGRLPEVESRASLESILLYIEKNFRRN